MTINNMPMATHSLHYLLQTDGASACVAKKQMERPHLNARLKKENELEQWMNVVHTDYTRWHMNVCRRAFRCDEHEFFQANGNQTRIYRSNKSVPVFRCSFQIHSFCMLLTIAPSFFYSNEKCCELYGYSLYPTRPKISFQIDTISSMHWKKQIYLRYDGAFAINIIEKLILFILIASNRVNSSCIIFHFLITLNTFITDIQMG